MRYCYLDGSLEFKCKQDVNNAPDELKPWFELTTLPNENVWIFGHWASLLGECNKENIFATDTGCVWGNHLTMMRWHDKKLFTQQAQT